MATPIIVQRRALLGGLSYGDNRTVNVDTPWIFQRVVDTGVTDLVVTVNYDYSQNDFVLLHSTREIKIETVSGTTPTDTIDLVAEQSILWVAGEDNCPFTADAVNFYITNTSGAAATVTIVLSHDSTI